MNQLRRVAVVELGDVVWVGYVTFFYAVNVTYATELFEAPGNVTLALPIDEIVEIVCAAIARNSCERAWPDADVVYATINGIRAEFSCDRAQDLTRITELPAKSRVGSLCGITPGNVVGGFEILALRTVHGIRRVQETVSVEVDANRVLRTVPGHAHPVPHGRIGAVGRTGRHLLSADGIRGHQHGYCPNEEGC